MNFFDLICKWIASRRIIPKKILLVVLLIENIFLFFYFVYFYNGFDVKSLTIDKTKENIQVWHDAPSLSIVCRTYANGVEELQGGFLLSYLLFWPIKQWPNVTVNLVFDDENIMDHQLGTVLAQLPPFPNIHYERKPIEPTFCSDWRSEGYSRQIFSNFYSDLYTNSEYIGIVDSDSILISQVTPEDLFVDRKPRIIGFNLCCSGWNVPIKKAIGIDAIGEFMVENAFPVLIKRIHFKMIRDHITKQMNARTFEQAFNLICRKYYQSKYSQFDLMIHYLWMHKRDEYSWHINEYRTFIESSNSTEKRQIFYQRLTDDPRVIDKNRPIAAVTKHFAGFHPNPVDYKKIIYDYLCLASDYQVGDCHLNSSPDIVNGAKMNFLVNYLGRTGKWEKRGMPSYIKNINEIPWGNQNLTWENAYQIHLKNIKLRYGINNKWKT